MKKGWRLGTIVSVGALEEGIDFCRSAGMDTLQVRLGDACLLNEADAAAYRAQMKDFPADTAAASWPGPMAWDFRNGPRTLGIGPAETREARMRSLLRGIEWADMLGIPLVQTHLGFVPEDPSCAEYAIHVECLRILGKRAGELGVRFCMETGQETPITLRRLIEDAGEKSVGVNLDPANLLMYGKANPTDAVDILAQHIASMHLKDGCYPGADSYQLGEEKAIGEGLVDFPSIFAKLRTLDFDGPMIIEREIPAPKQREDILASVPLLRKWMQEC